MSAPALLSGQAVHGGVAECPLNANKESGQNGQLRPPN